MNTLRRIGELPAWPFLLVVIVAIVIGVSACGGDDEPTYGTPAPDSSVDVDLKNEAQVIVVPRAEGGSVECVVWDGPRAGGLSCNWDAVNNPETFP